MLSMTKRQQNNTRASAAEHPVAGPARQLRALHKDLLAFQARMEWWFYRFSGGVGQTEGRFAKVDRKFDRLELGLSELRRDMPKIVRRAVREAFGSKRRKV